MVTEPEQFQDADQQSLIPEPTTEQPRERPHYWFKPGQSGNPAGRPRKGETAQDKLRTLVNRDADEILSGMSREAKKGNTRAFIALWDRAFGVPATKLIIQREDDPLSSWLERMTGTPIAPELPSRPQLPAPSQDST